MSSVISEVRMEEEGVQRSQCEAVGERKKRWSAKRKREAVTRLLRGETLDSLAHELKVPAAYLAQWREEFVSAGTEALKARPKSAEERRLKEAQHKVGELTSEVDILRALLEKKGAQPPRRRSK